MIRFSPDLVPALWFGAFDDGDELDVLAQVGDELRPYPCEMLWVPKDEALARLQRYIDGLRSCRRIRTREDVMFDFLRAVARADGRGLQLHDAEFQALAGRRELGAWRRDCLLFAEQVRSGRLEGDRILQSALADEVFEATGISASRWKCSRSWEWSLAGWRPAVSENSSHTEFTPNT